ncbi:DUF4198 domain-containing protein [Siccirubricoccus phaeus]|uniref:DUF4198 domain-containing protein n=1 Tax=Siccirubricoccus phaeus TaxID=2595053 RepID=UPI00165C6C5F|nr:DUF4198 domain-containing protein [Siccirubricoccus phaeus]
MMRWMPLAALLAVSGPAMAHQIWLEREGQTARAYFGEPVENVREKTGGLLDRIPGPRAFAADPAAPLPLTRAADHFSATLPAGTGDVRLAEEGLPPFGREEKTKTVMLAREGRSETRHALDLELVPVAPGGNEFTVLLRGQPLARAEVTLVAPPRWERKLRSNAEGRVQFETPWAGRYVAEVIHTEATPGGSGDGAYARLRYVSTLSFVAEGGIPWTER